MSLPAATYDLILMLDTEAAAPVRSKIVKDAREAIEAQGEMLRHDEWGERALAYPIDHRQAAEYHLLQFHSSTPELLSGLNGTLKIVDEIVRFRIVKLKAGTPEAPDMRAGRRVETGLGEAIAAPDGVGEEPDSEPVAAEHELPLGEPA
jgi:small subunit ribosomal protein S6